MRSSLISHEGSQARRLGRCGLTSGHSVGSNCCYRKVDNKLTSLEEAEDPGAEDDQDGSFKELHDAGQAEECRQN